MQKALFSLCKHPADTPRRVVCLALFKTLIYGCIYCSKRFYAFRQNEPCAVQMQAYHLLPAQQPASQLASLWDLTLRCLAEKVWQYEPVEVLTLEPQGSWRKRLAVNLIYLTRLNKWLYCISMKMHEDTTNTVLY